MQDVDSRVRGKWWTPTRIAQAVAIGLFLAAGVILALPVSGTELGQETTSTGAVVTSSVRGRSLVDDIGWGGLGLIVAVPLLLALVPMLLQGTWHKGTTVTAAVIAFGLCAIALLTVGAFFLPGVVALLVAAALINTRLAPAG